MTKFQENQKHRLRFTLSFDIPCSVIDIKENEENL